MNDLYLITCKILCSSSNYLTLYGSYQYTHTIFPSIINYKISVYSEYKCGLTKLFHTYSVCQDGHDWLWIAPGTLEEEQ